MIGGMHSFAEPSTLPFQLPPFADIGTDDFEPAFDTAMAMHLSAVRFIADNPEVPTFENTIVHLERVGARLTRVSNTFFNLTGTMSTEALREVEARVAPALTAHSDAHSARSRRCSPGSTRCTAAERHDSRPGRTRTLRLVRALPPGLRAGRGAARRRRPAPARRAQPASSRPCRPRSGRTCCRPPRPRPSVVDDVAELDGLTHDAIAAAADRRDRPRTRRQYVITLVLPTGQPLLTGAAQPGRPPAAVRGVGAPGRASASTTTGRSLLEIARLRARAGPAARLRHPRRRHRRRPDRRARIAAIDAFLARLVVPAVANAEAEAALLARGWPPRTASSSRPGTGRTTPSGSGPSSTHVDTAALRPYFELDRVLVDGVFHAAARLYGIELVPRTDLVGYHPDVRVWEVRDADGEPIGLFLGDYFAREGKRGGAWMSSFVDQSACSAPGRWWSTSSTCPRPAAGEPTLLTLDEVNTLFHEFGHALHGLFSAGHLPAVLRHRACPRDFVEYPSQVNEMWMLWPEVLEQLRPARRDRRAAADRGRRGDPRPPQLWGEGFGTARVPGRDPARPGLAPARRRTRGRRRGRVRAAGAGGRRASTSTLVPPRYRTTYFQHIFAGGYSAGYYSYIWSEVLDADTVEWFKENGGLRRENGDVFRSRLLSVGGSVDPLAAFRAVRGRDADIGPLLRRRGLDRAG